MRPIVRRVNELLARMPLSSQARTSPQNVADVLRALVVTDKGRADVLTDERRIALGSLITEWFGKQDADCRLLAEFDYCDSRAIDLLIDEAIAPAIADAVQVALAASPIEHPAGIADRVKAMFVPNPPGELGPTDEPESQYRFGHNTALEDVLAAVEQHEAAPTHLRDGTVIDKSVAKRLAIQFGLLPEPPAADERAAWEKVLHWSKYIRSALDTKEAVNSSISGAACDAGERAVWMESLARDMLARASSPNAAGAEGVPECNGSHDAGQIAAGDKECTACGGE
ncbi:hypothetical protein [Burkholderia vietnamiensis]|uniref:hypothetical protein n=1 Tax=Burkholderia vietnamiensis TaxID=60552 RepID=UPI001CF4EE5F|nr:hypothetical protein [Burkholderia vietnamiensis]MCA8266431.1 hypothetical protein [Burkholderia vietnamiensis]